MMKDRRNELAGVLLILLSLFVLLSLISYNPSEEPTVSPQVSLTNKTGIIGVYVSHFLIKITIGYASYIFPIIGLLWGWWIIGRKPFRCLIRLTIYAVAFACLLSVAIGLPAVVKGLSGTASYQYAGLVGGLVAKLLHDFVGSIIAGLILLMGGIVLVSIYFHWSFYHPVEKISLTWARIKERKKIQVVEKKKEDDRRDHTQKLLTQLQMTRENEQTAQDVGPDKPEILPPEPIPQEIEKEKSGDQLFQEEESLPWVEETPSEAKPRPAGEFSITEEVIEDEMDLDTGVEKPSLRKYQLPSVDLFDRHEGISPSASHEELVEKANFLIQSLLTFGVEGKVVNISPGPIITLFEVEPAEGVRVLKFVQLSDDLARVMEASRVRVIAPIPGKSSVGIEIPNKNPSIVFLRSVINSEKFVTSDSKLTVALGKTTSGENYVIRLEELPHILIAGTTGSGKSVCINSIITSLLYRATPDEVRFLLIDPKKLELAAYRPLEKYHLITSEDVDEYVITTPDNAVLALRSVEQEMGRRYDVLADSVVRNIHEYHDKISGDKGREPMPFIVVIIDELADLMLRAPKEVEVSIARLAQLARAVGIHLVLATQRPSVDVITGVIKANFPARIAFQVATRVDSRTIIDTNGAEKLLGKGDMLFLPPGSSQPIRLHNSFISLSEIKRIVNFITEQPTAEEIRLQGSKIQLADQTGIGGEGFADDKLFKDAVRLVITHQQGSISLLQRRLRIGYSRAARLIDEMEQLGIVGPFTGSKAREVLVDDSYLQVLEDDKS